MKSLARLSLVSLALLASCDLTRPGGAFQPKEYDPRQHGFGDEDADLPDEDPSSDDAGEQTDPPDGSDGPPVVVDPANPLSVLQGLYLMRVDVYSTASATSLGNTLTLNSRVSNLMIASLTPKDDGTLTAHETLCTQSYYHECVSNCSGWKTDVDPELPKLCVSRVIDRDYTVSAAGAFSAAASTIPIGFNEVDGNGALPVDPTDARVWTMGTPDQDRYGVNTHLTAKIGPLGTTSLDCIVSTVQRFATSFAGTLDLKTYGKDALVQKPMLADTAASTAATIYVDGVPTQYCNKAQLDTTSQQAPNEISVVRFKRYTGLNCPTSEAAYEALFPGVPKRPTQADLM
jgi:hypothetical protein